MSTLAWVIAVKIAATALLWVIPPLLAPRSLLAKAGLAVETVPWVRLLGWAYLALGVGYCLGLRDLLAGGDVRSTVIVGIVSNGGAGLLLAYHAATGALAGLSRLVRWVAYLSIALTLGIALALYWFGLR